MGNFDTTSSLAIILLAALIHASFQASVSALTLMSSHTLGSKAAHKRLLHLSGSFIAGVGAMTLFLLSTVSFLLSNVMPSATPPILWAGACGAVIGVGVSVWLFYFNKERGTTLWLPRGLARYLSGRAKSTKQGAEAFGLGLTSVASEIVFIFAPLLIASLVLIRLSPELQLIGVAIYAFVSLLPLLIFGTLIGGGHKLSHIQRWRESNKRFMQFAAGSGLFVLGVYVYVERVLVTSLAAAGGQ